MLAPPFKLAAPAQGARAHAEPDAHAHGAGCCGAKDDSAALHAGGRTRLAQLEAHLHCSVIGTCLSTAELRELMSRFLEVRGATDLDIHHDTVRLISQNGEVAKALHKALDQRHESVVRRLAKTHDAEALAAQWEEALRQGEIPAAYWAVLTHRHVTSELRQKVFGDVHMLSHLVGAANRADIRRLVDLEHENAELRDRMERQQARVRELVDERDLAAAQLRKQQLDAELRHDAGPAPTDGDALRAHLEETAATQIALHTERRERAEQASATALAEVARLQEELDHLKDTARMLSRELSAAETELRESAATGESPRNDDLDRQLRGRRILYVGGRPSSTPAIRELVRRHGGEFQRHDGGLEDRKGLLASAISRAEVVVFPVDCVDHDSVGNLKRLCARQDVAFIPLRSASVATFAAAFTARASEMAATPPHPSNPAICRHR